MNLNFPKDSWGQIHQHFTQSFYTRRSQKLKKTDSLAVFFALWESAGVIAVSKILAKSSPDS